MAIVPDKAEFEAPRIAIFPNSAKVIFDYYNQSVNLLELEDITGAFVTNIFPNDRVIVTDLEPEANLGHPHIVTIINQQGPLSFQVYWPVRIREEK